MCTGLPQDVAAIKIGTSLRILLFADICWVHARVHAFFIMHVLSPTLIYFFPFIVDPMDIRGSVES